MANQGAKRAVIIHDIKSKNIEQAIFILRGDEAAVCNAAVIEEANEIVQNYIKQAGAGRYRNIASKRKWFKWGK
ncbi:MAG: hypothetical protein LBH54_01105 [Clostridiales bacterium]|nr:hypothetical protein [Clostridiales bacterium]